MTTDVTQTGITIITSLLTSGVVAALIPALIERRKNKLSNQLSALKSAITLEGYAIDCANALSKHELAESSNGCAGTLLSRPLELPTFEIDPSLLALSKGRVADSMLTLEQEYQQANQTLEFLWDVSADPEECVEEGRIQARKLGALALALARDIRIASKLPKRAMNIGGFDVCKSLTEI